MTCDVLCLRPEADFQRVLALPPATLRVVYRGPGDSDVPTFMKMAQALVVPAVGPTLAESLFEGATVRFVQVTGAGLDRLNLQLPRQVFCCDDFTGPTRRFVAATIVIFARV